MSYSEALEQQVRLLGFWEAQKSSLGIVANEVVVSRGTSFLQALKFGDTYFWSHQMSGLLGSSAPSFPAEGQWSQEDCPSPLGFAWFDNQIGWRDPESGRWVAAKALTWRLGQTPNDVVANIGLIWAAGTDQKSDRPTGVLLVQWEQHETMVDAVKRAFDGAKRDRDNDSASALAHALFAAMTRLLAQRILVAPQQRAERHARRRLEKDGWTHEPLIRVVELRRKQSKSNGHGDHESANYAYQFVVSGHWHRYWMGKDGDEKVLQPRWLMPYVKGPEDKPLKPPRAKVFAVVR